MMKLNDLNRMNWQDVSFLVPPLLSIIPFHCVCGYCLSTDCFRVDNNTGIQRFVGRCNLQSALHDTRRREEPSSSGGVCCIYDWLAAPPCYAVLRGSDSRTGVSVTSQTRLCDLQNLFHSNCWLLVECWPVMWLMLIRAKSERSGRWTCPAVDRVARRSPLMLPALVVHGAIGFC